MVHVLCFGNLLHGDDGFGIHVYRCLQAHLAGRAMRVYEVGLRGLDALPLFEGCQRAILVDALHEPGSPAGTLRELAAAEIPLDSGANSHAAGVGYLLQALAATRLQAPPTRLIGAVAASVTPFTDRLSPPLAAALPAAVAAVLRHIPYRRGQGGR